MKVKLNLESLKVESFVTEKANVKGGANINTNYPCLTSGCWATKACSGFICP